MCTETAWLAISPSLDSWAMLCQHHEMRCLHDWNACEWWKAEDDGLLVQRVPAAAEVLDALTSTAPFSLRL